MASTIILSDNGVSSGSAGIKTTGGNDGVLILQTTTSGGTATAGLTINNAQEVAVPAGFSVAAGATENGIIVGGRSDNTSAYRNHMLFYRGNKTGSGIGFGTYGGGSNDATSLVWSNTSAGEGGSLNTNGIGLGSTNAPTTGIGIKFPATQSASTDANTLDDYEEGTFTPTYITTGTAFGSVSYALTGGRYVKIGKMVHFQLQLRTDSVTKGSASGNVRVSGLPFTCASNTGGTEDAYADLSFGEVSGFVTNNPSCGYVYPGTTQHSLFYRTTANGSSYNIIAVADIATGSAANVAYISGSYIASA